jgi:hypothetical protein
MADRQPGRLPLGKAVLQPPRPIAELTQQRDRLEREDTPGAATISDDLLIRRQLDEPLFQLNGMFSALGKGPYANSSAGRTSNTVAVADRRRSSNSARDTGSKSSRVRK